MKQFRVVAETDRNYPMGLTIDGKRIHVSVKWPGSACSLVLTEEQGRRLYLRWLRSFGRGMCGT